MKTAEEKAFDVARKWRSTAYHSSEEAADQLQAAISAALKEQDRETRESCAEAATREIYRQFELHGDITDNGLAAICTAIINVKAANTPAA